MSNTLVKNQLEEVSVFLERTVNAFETFLNNVTLDGLLEENKGNETYLKGLLSSLRKMTVFCEDGLDACRIIIKTEPFNKAAAQRVLYKIYHQCIEEYFNPRNDLWYEDSRSAYTGRNCIKFREDAPENLTSMVKNLESEFQSIREELEYYETDYRTKMVQSK